MQTQLYTSLLTTVLKPTEQQPAGKIVKKHMCNAFAWRLYLQVLRVFLAYTDYEVALSCKEH